MRRTIPVLRGLAILGVVFNHANWHILSEFAPGAPWGYLFIVTDQIGKFAIPAFMVISGYFTAYAAGGGKRDLPWSVIRTRVEALLWPWLLWSLIMMAGQSLQGRAISLVEFGRMLFIQYYFIPLLFFYYLLAPLIVRRARRDLAHLLVVSAILQALGIGLFYGRVYWSDFPAGLKSWVDLGPLQYLRFAFYFPFGLACGMFPRAIRERLHRFRPLLPWIVPILLALSVAEAALAYRMGGAVWPIGGDQTKLTSALFSTALLACFAAFDRLTLPFQRTATQIGIRSYGLYLAHYPILGLLAKAIAYAYARWIPQLDPPLAGCLLLPLLFTGTVGWTVGLMAIAARWLPRRIYRYAFG